MGCRFVAFLAITMLITLDLLSISAIPNIYLSSRFREKRFAKDDRRVPVHHRKLQKSQPFSDFNSIFSQVDNELTDKFLSFTSDPDTRIKFKFTKFDVLDGRDEYVSVYNGIPDEIVNMDVSDRERVKRSIQPTIQLNSNINLKSKSRSKRSFSGTQTGYANPNVLNTVTNLPFLMSSKPAVDNHDTSNIVLNHQYVSDTNKLTLHFINEQYDSDIFEKVKVEVSVTTENGDGNNWDIGQINNEPSSNERRRDLSTNDNNQKVTDKKVSFPVCCLGNINHETCKGNQNTKRSFVGSGGTISSHPSYSSDLLEVPSNEICRVSLKSENENENLRFTITTMQLANQDVNQHCIDIDDAYLKFTDIKNNKTENLCYADSQREFEFGHEVELELHTGSWGSLKGFEILYAAVASGKKVENKISKIHSKDEESSNEEESTNLDTASALSNSKFATTSIIVGIVLLIVVLIVCGLVFMKSVGQDQIITELQQQLDKLRVEASDQSNLLNSDSSIITMEDPLYEKPSFTKISVPRCNGKEVSFVGETAQLINKYSSEDEKCLHGVNFIESNKQ